MGLVVACVLVFHCLLLALIVHVWNMIEVLDAKLDVLLEEDLTCDDEATELSDGSGAIISPSAGTSSGTAVSLTPPSPNGPISSGSSST